MPQLTPDVPVPPVSPEDMKRIWDIPGPADVKFLERLCSPRANVLAVNIRLSVLKLLLEQRMLDPWRKTDGTVPDKVVEVFARCSLVPRGGPGEGKIEFDLPAILKSLEEDARDAQ